MSLLPVNSSRHLPENEDKKTLLEISLFAELIKNESVIGSMARSLRYERHQQISQEDQDRTTINILLDNMKAIRTV
jgi:hypothetical protein